MSSVGPQNAPKSLAAGAMPHTPLGELTALPRSGPLARFKGASSKAPTSKVREGSRLEKKKEERGG